MTHGVRIALSACGVSGPCSCGEHPVAWTLDPAKLREAITRELTGKEAGDGADRMNGPTREATAELIARFAATGRDDPTIAVRLGITVAQVRGLREEFGILPGETRWTPRHHAGRAQLSEDRDHG